MQEAGVLFRGGRESRADAGLSGVPHRTSPLGPAYVIITARSSRAQEMSTLEAVEVVEVKVFAV
jgi:hypothetical protein